MTKRQNCWEFKNCGFGPDGENAQEKGSCPAALRGEYDGVNGGQAAGRFCWMVGNTRCCESCSIDVKFITCTECDFYQLVEREEERELILTKWDLIEGKRVKVNIR